MKRHTNITDPDFLEAYDNITDLLQKIIDRQCQLRHQLRQAHNIERERVYEHKVNADVLAFVQWVRYHFWGNDDKTIISKTNITGWEFRQSYDGYSKTISIVYSPFICSLLGVEPLTYAISATELVEAILNSILPKREHSIFAIEDHVEESINLKLTVDRIKNKIHPNDSIH